MTVFVMMIAEIAAIVIVIVGLKFVPVVIVVVIGRVHIVTMRMGVLVDVSVCVFVNMLVRVGDAAMGVRMRVSVAVAMVVTVTVKMTVVHDGLSGVEQSSVLSHTCRRPPNLAGHGSGRCLPAAKGRLLRGPVDMRRGAVTVAAWRRAMISGCSAMAR